MALAAPAASPANIPAAFDLKSASLTLVALVLKTPDLAALAEELEQKLGATPEAFSHDPTVIDLAQVAEGDAEIDFEALAALLRRYRLQPAGVRGGSPAQMEAALAAGLGDAPEAPAREPRIETRTETVVQTVEVEVVREVLTPTLIIDKPLRSGQQAYARGGDLVVLAAVNFGAEVIADGNVHVYAPLRGKAIAGARGKTDARIFSTCLEPELVAIAGTYRTTETPLPPEVAGKAAQIRLEGERLVFEPLN